VRAEYGVGSVAPAVELAAAPTRVFTIRLPGLPSLAGLLVEDGDVVVAGQPIARYVDDDALERAEGEVERARRGLALTEAALVGAEDLADSERVRLAEDVRRAVEELKRVERLVDSGARPRVEVVEAGRRVEDARPRVLDGLTRWTSERGRLLGAVEKARAGIVAAERELVSVMEGQWVRAVVGGVVVKVSLDAGERGQADSEVLILTDQ